MKIITNELLDEVVLSAKMYADLRKSCKQFLEKHGKNYDKFTVVDHDGYIGYISEFEVSKYLKELLDDDIKITSWDENFNLESISKIVHSDNVTETEIKYVESYFYDDYDLMLKSETNEIKVDIKTALTSLEPKPYWNFMYPVVQAEKPGKEFMILTYYVTNQKDVTSFKKLMIVGVISEKRINNCKLIHKGSRTRFGTISQTDNFITEISADYVDIQAFINEVIK